MRTFSLLLIAAALAACGGGEPGESADAASPPSSTAPARDEPGGGVRSYAPIDGTPFRAAPAQGEPDDARPPADPAEEDAAVARTYHRGPRGGCYTYTSTGNKRYVDRSLCD